MIIVTGAAGFIGSRIVYRGLEKGLFKSEEVIGVDELGLWNGRRCTRSFRSQIKWVDHESLLSEFPSFKPRAVIHMGACSSTDETREDYLEKMNTAYTRSLFNLCVEAQVPFVYASSGATYGSGSLGFSDEPTLIPRLEPLNKYGESKQRFDVHLLEQLKSGAKLPPQWVGLKFFNVYGPGEWHKGKQSSVVLHARNQIDSTGKLKLFKSHRADVPDGEQRRDFVYVDDAVDVALAAYQGRVKPGIYNVGSGEARTFLDLGSAVFSSLNLQPKVEFIDTPSNLRTHYQYYTCADLKRLRAAGYTEQMTSLESGVQKYFQEWSRDL
jgi:ADP-L-glycero-D-manno-heptose 6-epimerase